MFPGIDRPGLGQTITMPFATRIRTLERSATVPGYLWIVSMDEPPEAVTSAA